MNKNILEFNFLRQIDCSKEVAFWNYWDHEHLDVVHSSYSKSDILYDRKDYMFRIDEIKLPIFSFLNPMTSIFTVQQDENTMLTYAVQLGVLSKTTIKIESLSKRKCEINMNYKFYLNGWRKLLKPMLKIMVPKWNEKVWKEDYPIKIRRQKVIDLNFKDFVGLPSKIEEREFKGDIKLHLPLPRLKKSPRDKHPLKK
tara:strand:+ start:3552 stop:4145 length:594 start_codon:yes stop_codon:yes gene_type:complete